MERCVVVSSEDSLRYFPNNHSTQFTTVLSNTMHFDGKWSIGLKAIRIGLNETQPTTVKENPYTANIIFDVLLSQASGTILGGEESMLLQRVYGRVIWRDKAMAVTYENCIMVPVRVQKCDRFDIIIKPVQLEGRSFDVQTATHATLLLKKER